MLAETKVVTMLTETNTMQSAMQSAQLSVVKEKAT